MAKKTSDDLFEGSTMSFGEHLEELRVSLFRAVLGVALGCVIGFFVANNVIRFFQSPLERAMQRFYLDKSLSDLKATEYKDGVPVEIQKMILDQGIIPEPVQIETGRFADTIGLSYPGQFGDVKMSPYWFTEGDLHTEGAAGLARRLADAGKSESPSPARQLWQLLTSEDRQRVESLAKSPGTLSRQESADLLAILNRVAGNRELHEAPELANLTGPDADTAVAAQSVIGWLLGQATVAAGDTVADLRRQLAEKFDEEKSRRLNKLLIARMFPDSLQKARVSLLTLYAWRPVKVRFQVLNAQEAFMIWVKAALMTGLTLAAPYVFYQIWIFVAAGLYPHEKHYVFLYLPMSLALFFGGAALAFVFVFDPVLDFLFTFNKGMNADFDPRIGEWLGFVLILPIGFGLGFQLPLVMLFINRIGLVSTELFVNQWRIAVLTIFIIAMVLTPAEPISMLLMAGPLCLLYVFGIVLCKYMPKGRNPFAEAYEP